MKKMTFYILLVLVGIVFTLDSCKKESNNPVGCSANWAAEVQAEISNYSNAAMAYANNPTTETCNAYKTAYQDYIDALKPFLNCATYTPQQKAELQAAINEAESDISTLCDE